MSFNRYKIFLQRGYEYPKSVGDINVQLVEWLPPKQPYKVQISWFVSGIPYTAFRKVYYKKNSSMYFNFMGKRIDLIKK